MAIYIVLSLMPDTTALNNAVTGAIPESGRYKLQADSGWLVKFEGTSTELSNTLGITGQADGTQSPLGSALVSAISGYYGRASIDMWEWLKARFEQ